MPYETLLVEIEEAVATITLNRPAVLNALNKQLFDDLDAAITALAADESVGVLLITGAGDKAFAAGADIAELAETTLKTGEALALRGQSVFARIETCGKPVIAAINGFALGGGCELALACTLRLAADTARLGQPEVKLGLLPGYGGTQRLPRLIGSSAALKLLLTGDIIPAQEALRLGLVDEVHPAANLLTAALALAQKIASQAPLAVQACLEAVQAGADLPFPQALALEAHLFGQLSQTQDKIEGTQAFLAKRPPVWSGK